MHYGVEEESHGTPYAVVRLRRAQVDEGGTRVDDLAAEIGRILNVLYILPFPDNRQVCTLQFIYLPVETV